MKLFMRAVRFEVYGVAALLSFIVASSWLTDFEASFGSVGICPASIFLLFDRQNRSMARTLIVVEVMMIPMPMPTAAEVLIVGGGDENRYGVESAV